MVAYSLSRGIHLLWLAMPTSANFADVCGIGASFSPTFEEIHGGSGPRPSGSDPDDDRLLGQHHAERGGSQPAFAPRFHDQRHLLCPSPSRIVRSEVRGPEARSIHGIPSSKGQCPPCLAVLAHGARQGRAGGAFRELATARGPAQSGRWRKGQHLVQFQLVLIGFLRAEAGAPRVDSPPAAP